MVSNIFSSDSLRIHDGPNTSFPVIGKPMCGYKFKNPPLIESSSNTILIRFQSDNIRTYYDLNYRLSVQAGKFEWQYLVTNAV